ncbi:MAG: hypothetical protein IJ197_08790 [Bacteroidaceae bacterium]|nr:hypothetical protein [Bacteroidaceae bacterium]
MAEEKLMRLSRVTRRSKEEIDSVLRSKRLGNRRAFDVLFEAQAAYNGGDRYRKDRWRNKRYTYGDQLGDEITVDGKTITEEQHIIEQGNAPLKNNLIRRLVRNVLGVYRGQSKEPTCTARDRNEQRVAESMTTLLQYVRQINTLPELEARSFEEYLIGSLAVQKKWYGWNEAMQRTDCWTKVVDPNRFIVDVNMRDFRGWDVGLIGELHDIDFNTLCCEFAESPDDYDRLYSLYTFARDRHSFLDTWEEFGFSRRRNYDFMFCSDPTRCRVIEVWRKEAKPRYRCHDYNTGEFFKIEVDDYKVLVEDVNNDRIRRGLEAGFELKDIPLIEAKWFVDSYWYFYYLTPFGDILKEGETPYDHKSHPYVFKPYPFIDGELHSFVADVIDQQRYVNRLITMYDFIMRASAKGVLLFPEDSMPRGMSIEDIAEEWSRFDGILLYRPKPGIPIPQQIANNSTNIGISELLNLQLKFFEDISGVNGALQGKPGYSSTSGVLYAQQANNATTSLLDLLESYSSFIKDAAYKDMSNILQFYDEKTVKMIAGENASLAEMQNILYDMSVVESTSTPAYRAIANEFLMEIWRQGQITLEQLLEHGDFPFADELLQSIQSQSNQMQEGQQVASMPPQLAEQARQGANMDSVNNAYDMLRNAA